MSNELGPLPPYVYGRECSANERVLPLDEVLAYAAAEVAKERERYKIALEWFAEHGKSIDRRTDIGEVPPSWQCCFVGQAHDGDAPYTYEQRRKGDSPILAVESAMREHAVMLGTIPSA